MDKKIAADIAGVAAVLALGAVGNSPFPRSRYSRRECGLCHKPIMAGDGFRTVAGLGDVHGKCAQERDKTQVTKVPEPYSTTYPAFLGRRWMWFDVAVYARHPPNIGNLPTEVFLRLKGGDLTDAHDTAKGAYRQYKSRAKAIADYRQAVQ